MAFYINSKKEASSERISYFLTKCIQRHCGEWKEIVFLCIGSDRITGDCLGPYIGQQLLRYPLRGITVYGTLEQPIHALNLDKSIQYIQRKHPHALVIAIDASLGTKKHLGYVTIGNGSLSPGAGVSKTLSPVGDIYITGIVNTAGFLEHLTLQTTRLSTVLSLAVTILQGILCSLRPRHFLSAAALEKTR